MEKHAIDQRSALESGGYGLTVEEKAQRKSPATTTTIDVLFSGDHVRYKCAVTSGDSGRKSVMLRNGVRAGSLLDSAWPSEGQPKEAQLLDMTRVSIDQLDLLYRPFDPRAIGMYCFPLSVSHGKTLHSLFRGQERKSVVESRVTLNDRPAILIESEWANGYRSKAFFDPAADGALVRLEGADKKTVELLDIELFQIDSVWFPRKYSYRRSKDSKEILAETITVSNASFNRPVDVREFAVSACLPDGVRVTDVFNNAKQLIVTAGQLVPDVGGGDRYAHVPAVPTPPADEPTERGVWPVASFIGFASLGTLCLAFYIRHRQSKA